MAQEKCRKLCENDPKVCCNVVFVNDWETGYHLCEKYSGILHHELDFKTDIIDRTSYWRKDCPKSESKKDLGKSNLINVIIFNVEKGVFRSFSTRHQFYTFTKLKSFLPRFPSSLQLFLFFRFLLFSPLTCPVPLYLLEIQSCFLRLATRYLHGRRSNLQWRIDLPIFRAKSIAKD